MGRKRVRNYFTNITEIAILAYCKTNDKDKKEKIYTRFIYPSFDKLIENVMFANVKSHNYEGSYEELRQDCFVWLFDRLNNFDQTKGKAFSYFNVITRNYIWQRNKAGYKKSMTHLDYTRPDIVLYDDEVKEDFDVFLNKYVNVMNENIKYIFPTVEQIQIGIVVIDLISKRQMIEDINKSMLLDSILIKTGVDNYAPIRNVFKILTWYFNEMYANYLETDEIVLPDYKINTKNG